MIPGRVFTALDEAEDDDGDDDRPIVVACPPKSRTLKTPSMERNLGGGEDGGADEEARGEPWRESAEVDSGNIKLLCIVSGVL